VKKSLEEFSNIENSDNQIEQNTSSSLDELHTCEEFNVRSLQVSATDSKSSQAPSQTQIPECCNKPKHTNTSTQTQAHNPKNTNKSNTTARRVEDDEHMTDPDRLPSGNKSSPEDRVKTIIENHQEAIR
jgi:hypothetical protein